MQFRLLQMSDKAEIRALFDEMSEESAGFVNQNHTCENFVMSLFEKEIPDRRYYVMEDDGLIKGIIWVRDIHTRIPWLGIAVRERFKGQHIGTNMINALSDILLKENKGGILLTTAKNNVRGQALYEKCGFERLGVHEIGEYMYIKRFEQ